MSVLKNRFSRKPSQEVNAAQTLRCADDDIKFDVIPIFFFFSQLLNNNNYYVYFTFRSVISYRCAVVFFFVMQISRGDREKRSFFVFLQRYRLNNTVETPEIVKQHSFLYVRQRSYTSLSFSGDVYLFFFLCGTLLQTYPHAVSNFIQYNNIQCHKRRGRNGFFFFLTSQKRDRIRNP